MVNALASWLLGNSIMTSSRTTKTGYARFLEIEAELKSHPDFGKKHHCMSCCRCPECRPRLTAEERERLEAWDRDVAVWEAEAAAKNSVLLLDPPCEILELQRKAEWSGERPLFKESAPTASYERQKAILQADADDDFEVPECLKKISLRKIENQNLFLCVHSRNLSSKKNR